MKSVNKIVGKDLKYFLLVIFMVGQVGYSQTYDPMGNPKKWNFQVTPFLYLPWVSGDITVSEAAKNYNAPAIDLLKNLKMAFMITADVSRGKFFISPTYVYTKIGTDKDLKNDKEGNPALVAVPELKMNILELIAGMRFRASKKIDIDPYIGFRYNHFNSSFVIETLHDTVSGSDIIEFWDPAVGFEIHYFPVPRVPINFNGNVGGFGAGSQFSYLISLNSGYSISQYFDILGGFTVYGFNYESTIGNDIKTGMTTNLFGFNIGLRVFLPARDKDHAEFRKTKK